MFVSMVSATVATAVPTIPLSSSEMVGSQERNHHFRISPQKKKSSDVS
jgi:hypothetical protein